MSYLKTLYELFIRQSGGVNRLIFNMSICSLVLVNLSIYLYLERVSILTCIISVMLLLNLSVKRVFDMRKTYPIKSNLFIFNRTIDMIIEILWTIARMFYISSTDTTEHNLSNNKTFVTSIIILFSSIAMVISQI